MTNRLIGLVLIAVGAVVAWQGWEKQQSLAGRIGEMLGGDSEPYIWMAAGGAAAVVGLLLVLRR